MVQMEPEVSLLGDSLLLREAHVSVPFRPSPDRVRPTHIMVGNLLLRSSSVLALISPENSLQADT